MALLNVCRIETMAFRLRLLTMALRLRLLWSMERDMAKDDRIQKGILGDIRPVRPSSQGPVGCTREEEIVDRELENDEAMDGGSRHDESPPTGSRDMTGGS